MPHSAVCIGSRLAVSLFSAKVPVSCARSIHFLSCASVAMVSYRLVSNVLARKASIRRAAKEIGVMAGAGPPAGILAASGASKGSWPCRPAPLGIGAGAAGVAAAGSAAAAAIAAASMPILSATRCVSVLKPIALRKAIRFL